VSATLSCVLTSKKAQGVIYGAFKALMATDLADKQRSRRRNLERCYNHPRLQVDGATRGAVTAAPG
jgi:hypothetical protein